MSRPVALLAALALAAPVSAFAADYEIDSGHTAAGFAVKHLMVSTVRGHFSNVKGTIHFDPKNPAADTVEATIDASTVSTDNAQRDTHLKSPDFFDVAKFPTITFKSTHVAAAGADKLKVTGDFTMHGVTKSVVLDVEGPSKEAKDPWGNVKSGATATTKISRKDFGLVWNKALESGGVVVGDEVTITLDIEMLATQPKTAVAK
jgi:polyisoprenoid-binding protein YceI